MDSQTMKIETQRIVDIARAAASANLRSWVADTIVNSTTTDSTGRDAIRITFVLTPGSSAAIEGDAALKTLVQIRQRLEDEGDERFPIIEYATKDELEESGDQS
jgi:hypothetical protein